MLIDALVFEIGSTTTLVNAFNGLDTENPTFLGGAQYRTTVDEGDVTIGLKEAIKNLEKEFGEKIEYKQIFATSSAAGGLKMSVHGLVHDMTVRAAKEAALGAGANISFLTSGKLRRTDLAKIKEIKPNIILIAGGVDYGERDTAIYNTEKILELDLNIPVIYAGNIENQDEIKLIFKEFNKENNLFVVDNVYPSIDKLNVEPTRAVIQNVFESHITNAKGMERIREMVDSSIIPTPGSVMLATKLLAEYTPDVVTIDVGGATTDIHSVTEGSEEINEILISPEPKAKRTVEGDLGLYVNRENLINLFTIKEMSEKTNLSEKEVEEVLKDYKAIPTTENEKKVICLLNEKAVHLSIHRHAGSLIDLYSSTGKKSLAQGKDLTSIKTIVGTGGALARLDCSIKILNNIPNTNKGDKLLPLNINVLIDTEYIMASLGVLSKSHPKAALRLLKKSLEIIK